MGRTPHRLLHLVEADHPAMPPPEGDAAIEQRERGGDLSALACAAYLDADDASAHAVVALGPGPCVRRAALLGVAPVARAPVPFGTPHATANALRKVVRHCGVRFDACIAWSAFAARVGRLTGFGPARGDFAPLLEADPHRPDPETSKLEMLRGHEDKDEALRGLAERVMQAAEAPAALPMGRDADAADRPRRIVLLADPALSGSAALAWRGSILTSAASTMIELWLPAGCAGARRVGRLPDAGRLHLVIDADPLPQRLARADAALAIYGPQAHQHASPGLVAYALSMGVPVVAQWERLADGHPLLTGETRGLHLVRAPVPIEISRALLEALGVSRAVV